MLSESRRCWLRPGPAIAVLPELVEQRSDLSLKIFKALVRRADDPSLVLTLGDFKLVIHASAKPPDFFQLSRRHAQIAEKRRFAGQLGRYGDADNGNTKKGMHEVSLPITPCVALSIWRARYVQTLALTPQLLQRVCEGRPRKTSLSACRRVIQSTLITVTIIGRSVLLFGQHPGALDASPIKAQRHGIHRRRLEVKRSCGLVLSEAVLRNDAMYLLTPVPPIH